MGLCGRSPGQEGRRSRKLYGKKKKRSNHNVYHITAQNAITTFIENICSYKIFCTRNYN